MRTDEGQAEPAAPRWLDAEEREVWVTVAASLTLLDGALDARLQREAGMSHFEYRVLAILSEATDRTAPTSQLAILTNGSLSRLSHTTSRLEKRGWVARRPDPSNGRVTLVTLTDEGWAKLVEAAPGHVEMVRRMVFDPLTKAQQRHLGEAHRRILKALTYRTAGHDARGET